MLTRVFRRVGTTLIAASIALTLVAPVLAARKAGGNAVEPQTNAVIHDCLDHNELTRHFSLTELRVALHKLGPVVIKYTFCGQAVRSGIAALEGPAGRDTVAAVTLDCKSHRGALTHQYSLTVLRSARQALPIHPASDEACREGIASQLSTVVS
jgi:hypothetical protein